VANIYLFKQNKLINHNDKNYIYQNMYQ